MSTATDFLNSVLEKIKVQMQVLTGSLRDIQQDINQMNEYYWLNYAEMDEYGYEDYDNQQALQAQMQADEDNKLALGRMERMLDSPFFGSVNFLFEGEQSGERFYIGIANFSERRGSVPLIYDWRAPISSLFYDYDKGEASYDSPAGRVRGEILDKWQYKIKNGRMIYELESDMRIDDEILMEELSGNSDTSLKNIVRTIQKEQNAIIRNTTDRIMVIQGSAGSGKTSVALHRIAYLLYHDRQNLKSSNVLVLSPNSVFSDYISHILPELGEENIQEMSLDLFAYRELKGTVDDCQDRWDQIEHQMAGMTRENMQRYRWKQSAEFIQAMEGFLVELEDRLVNFRTVTFGTFEKTEEELLHLYYEQCANTPILDRMAAVQEFFVDEYETLAGRDLEDEELQEITDQFTAMYVTTDLYEIYNWFLEEQGLPLLPDLPVEERVLDYEDVYPMLYLQRRLKNGKPRQNIRHLVIDEMQDYSYLQYVLLRDYFPCSMTILGDAAQTVDEYQRDVREFLPDIFGKKIRQLEMKKSYRNTVEIATYASQIIGDESTQYLDRHGKPVQMLPAAGEDGLTEQVLKFAHVGPGAGEDAYETAAVLTMTEVEARDLYQLLCIAAEKLPEKDRPQVSYVDRDSSRFNSGITVTTFYMAKGLEFDQVFVAGGDPKNPLYTQYQYICATRALHELYVFGDRSD